MIAAGTTAARTLEAAAADILAGHPFTGETSIFISYALQIPDHRRPDGNFHLPGTSLLMLLDAFLQSKGAQTLLA